MLKSLVHRAGRAYIREIVKSEAEGQKPRPINERPIELAFVFDAIRDLQPARILDVGVGQSPLPALFRNCGAHVTAIDNVRDYWTDGLVNRHWHVIDADVKSPKNIGRDFDLVTCISVIEHIADHVTAFRSLIEHVRPAGYVVVTCPYNEGRFVQDVYELPGMVGEPQAYPCSSYDRATVNQWLAAAPAELVRQDYWRMWTGEVWRQGDRVAPPQRVSAEELHQISCMLFRRR
jgi:SAM-dependent methyltransferase